MISQQAAAVVMQCHEKQAVKDTGGVRNHDLNLCCLSKRSCTTFMAVFKCSDKPLCQNGHVDKAHHTLIIE